MEKPLQVLDADLLNLEDEMVCIFFFYKYTWEIKKKCVKSD